MTRNILLNVSEFPEQIHKSELIMAPWHRLLQLLVLSHKSSFFQSSQEGGSIGIEEDWGQLRNSIFMVFPLDWA